MSFKIEKYNNGDGFADNYYDTCVMPSGQTIKIEFQEEWSKRKYYYNVHLVIVDKRKSKHDTYLKSTGKDGLSSLIWAKQKVKEFEGYIGNQHIGIPKTIYCRWDNGKRRNVYAYGLKESGYKFNMVFGCKALSKMI